MQDHDDDTPSAVQNSGTAPQSAGPEEASKGGEGGPLSHPSNAQFVQAVMGTPLPGTNALLCAIPGDPTAAGWYAKPVADADEQCPETANNYLNSSTFRPLPDGQSKARNERFAAYHFVLLDDVGTKIPIEKLAGFVPTWVIETSPGNFQWGIVLKEPITDLAAVSALQAAVVAAGLSDAGAKGAARWARLPNAINGKPKYQTDGQPFNCRLVQWNPDVVYTIDELTEALGLRLSAPSRSASAQSTPALATPSSSFGPSGVFKPKPPINPVVDALNARGLYKRELAPGKHDITCPWVTDHTDELDGGTAYFEPSAGYPMGGFCCQHSHGADYSIGQLIEELGVEPYNAIGKARIRTLDGQLNDVTAAAEFLLAETGEFFQNEGTIQRVHVDAQTGELMASVVNDQQLLTSLGAVAVWERRDQKSGFTRCDPPAKYVQAVLRAQEHQHLPVLRGLARQPYLRETDGQLVEVPGYDPISGIFSHFDASAYHFPEPTPEAAEAALAELQRLIREFHFAAEVDRSATLSAIITATLRPGLPVAPAYNITASMPGSGKSLLARLVSHFAAATASNPTGYPTSGEEAGKAILAALLSSPAAIIFDDMQTDWKPHSVMNRLLTSETIQDRVLGASRTATVSTRVLVLGTGNNIEPVGDMTRRVITIRLHPKTASPFDLTYEDDPVATIMAQRPAFIAHVLTIVRAWQAAGYPRSSGPSIASFNGRWDDFCRQPLIWLGLPDPAGSLIQQVRSDPYLEPLRGLLRAWISHFGEKSVTVRQVIAAAADNEALREALEDLPFNSGPTFDRNRFGYFLKRNLRRIVDGLELQDGDLTERKSWRAVRVGPEGGKGG